MAGSSVRHLAVVAPVAVALEAPLPPSEFATYQRQLLVDFLVSRRATTSPTTVHASLSALRANLFPWLEQRGRYVWEVTPGDLDAWAASLKNSVKTRTHHGYFAQVAHFYEWLVVRRGDELRRRLGVAVTNPVDRFNRARRLPEGERLVPVPREEAVDYLLAASRSRIQDARSDTKWLQACRNYALWMVFNWAGVRRAEAAALARNDIDLVAGTLRVADGKHGKGRLVHLQPPLAPVLRWYLFDVRVQDPRGRRSAALFMSPRGEALNPGGIANLLHTEQIAAGLPAEDCFTPHGLRRAYATRLYKALRAQGFRDPLVYVKEQLGHEYLSTTQRYCQLDDDYKYFLVQEATVALTRHYTSGTPEEQQEGRDR